jgi:hypothetical protein
LGGILPQKQPLVLRALSLVLQEKRKIAPTQCRDARIRGQPPRPVPGLFGYFLGNAKK